VKAYLPDRTHPKSRYRVAFVSRNPSQWQGPLFARIAASETIQPHAYYLSAVGLGIEQEAEMGAVPNWDSLPVLAGYKYSFVERSFQGTLKLVRELATQHYDAVILEGYREQPFMFATLYAILSNTPRFLRIDSILLYEQEKPHWKFKRRLYPAILHGFTGFLALSSLTVQYLQALGIASERIFIAPYTIDNHWYARLADERRPQREALRAQLGLPTDLPVVVAVLRFVERERPLDLLKAINVLQRKGIRLGTILIGDGPQRAEIEEFIRSQNLQEVVLPGFLPLSDLPRFYAMSDLFVHPAVDECWGLSVNEAMACRLPVIASDRVGAGHDLIRPDQTGLTYRAGDVDVLARCIERLIVDGEECKDMGRQAQEFIFEYWNYEKSIAALHAALERFADRQSSLVL